MLNLRHCWRWWLAAMKNVNNDGVLDAHVNGKMNVNVVSRGRWSSTAMQWQWERMQSDIATKRLRWLSFNRRLRPPVCRVTAAVLGPVCLKFLSSPSIRPLGELGPCWTLASQQWRERQLVYLHCFKMMLWTRARALHRHPFHKSVKRLVK